MAEPLSRVAGNSYGREDAIRALRCIDPKALGCGRQIAIEEYESWDRDTKFEYRQSGWCLNCQDVVFADPNEDGCICMSVDVGVGVITYVDDFCAEHGDPVMIRIATVVYDPDLREDEPPNDINEIEWTNYGS